MQLRALQCGAQRASFAFARASPARSLATAPLTVLTSEEEMIRDAGALWTTTTSFLSAPLLSLPSPGISSWQHLISRDAVTCTLLLRLLCLCVNWYVFNCRLFSCCHVAVVAVVAWAWARGSRVVPAAKFAQTVIKPRVRQMDESMTLAPEVKQGLFENGVRVTPSSVLGVV